MPILSFFGSPRLYALYSGQERTENYLESSGNTGMSFVRGVYYFVTSLAFSPVIIGYMYYRGYMQPQPILTLLRYVGYVVLAAFGSRLIGRAMDPQYRQFLDVWVKASQGDREKQQELKRFDFEIYGVQPDFEAVPNDNLWYLTCEDNQANFLVRGLSYYAIHAFGRHMLYPGSLAFLNWLMASNLQAGRRLMVLNKGGQRAWIKTTEEDLIDAMFIRGNRSPERSQTLVITCEGNAGFYEIGIANTPAELGYSVLGWNQPGFGESSGLPHVRNTLAAAEAIMQYAKSLGFKEENIVLFGWSIGGFPVSWLAANYPNIRGVILDATFDDVLPLAASRMPRFLGSIVEYAIRTHANLQIEKILARYKGPLKLIRRLQEEILIIDDADSTEATRRATNRGNFLLKSVLKSRHPELYEGLEPQVDRWLALSPTERLMAAGPSESEVARRRRRLYAACDHYFIDFDSNHVSPLDPGYFNIPELIKEF
ncbi:unnamed protein product [Caenorhabditis auriculariae]|uniref:AB hydrolase-1 domain-containing protein n=1 Tax=Caenorhabditis auriculariae TaxID=2777116 RepID=A0A8S1GZ25_9PELO|nr:unnamed protein product [Caenorhabditis auriculariae]